jgi:hypothetical protein
MNRSMKVVHERKQNKESRKMALMHGYGFASGGPFWTKDTNEESIALLHDYVMHSSQTGILRQVVRAD